jgi:hypothetical protein
MSNNASISTSKTVIFHPGMGKTATSAIQNLGLKYTTPNHSTYFSPHGILGRAHNLFSSNHPHFSFDKFSSHWDKLLIDLEKYDGNVVISSEFLIFDNTDHISSMISQIKRKGFNVQVLFGVRSYSNYLISAFLQAVKVNWGINENEDIFSYSRRELENLRLPMRIDNWAKYVGDENVFLMNYDLNKEQFVKQFFNAIGLKINELEDNTNSIVNPSIKLSVAPMLRHFDRVNAIPSQRDDFINYLNTLKFNEKNDLFIKSKIENEIVRNTYNHDIERLTERYNWVNHVL